MIAKIPALKYQRMKRVKDPYTSRFRWNTLILQVWDSPYCILRGQRSNFLNYEIVNSETFARTLFSHTPFCSTLPNYLN